MKRHVSPTDAGRQSHAPYNFVALPERVLARDEAVPSFEAWHTQLHSGLIDVSIETLTPLFIRDKRRDTDTGPLADARLRPRPFLAPDGRTPAIPASSLRGMLRSLVEILSFSRISNVSSDRPFYRALWTDRVSQLYRQAMAGAMPPRGGILRKDGHGWYIQEHTVARVMHKTITAGLPEFQYDPKPSYVPAGELQGKPIWATVENGICVEIRVATGETPTGFVEARLVLTGSAGGWKKPKTKEFVFIPIASPPRIDVPEPVLTRACDDDQVTGWQERAFPPVDGRTKAGVFAEGDAVFFGFFAQLEDTASNPEGLFFGRAGMFRLPYDLSPRDLVPDDQKGRSPLDLATSLFGRVDEKGGKGEAFASRIRFADAKAVGNRTDWFEALLVPRILSSPKPTAFAHYLVQDGRLPVDQLRTYVREDLEETTIRGHKLYWHRWDRDRGLSAVTWVDPKTGSADRYTQTLGQMSEIARGTKPASANKQCTVMTPIKAGVRFEGTIRFDNLRPEELGALLAALRLPEGCAHRLGMGKPLGLGSVKIETTVRFLDPKARYGSWGDGGYSECTGKETACAKAFESLVLPHAESTGEPFVRSEPTPAGLRKIARLDSLFALLSWEGRKGLDGTSYPTLEEYQAKLVLPTPAFVFGSDDPVPAEIPSSTHRPPQPGGVSRIAPGATPRPGAASAPPAKAMSKGDTVQVVVLPREQWLKKGKRPTVTVVGRDASGQLSDPLPEGIEPGQTLPAIVMLVSATKGQCQFQAKGS